MKKIGSLFIILIFILFEICVMQQANYMITKYIVGIITIIATIYFLYTEVFKGE